MAPLESFILPDGSESFLREQIKRLDTRFTTHRDDVNFDDLALLLNRIDGLRYEKDTMLPFSILQIIGQEALATEIRFRLERYGNLFGTQYIVRMLKQPAFYTITHLVQGKEIEDFANEAVSGAMYSQGINWAGIKSDRTIYKNWGHITITPLTFLGVPMLNDFLSSR